MGGNNNGDAAVGDGAQVSPDALAEQRVHAHGRLIQNQQLGIVLRRSYRQNDGRRKHSPYADQKRDTEETVDWSYE